MYVVLKGKIGINMLKICGDEFQVILGKSFLFEGFKMKGIIQQGYEFWY